MLLRPKFLAALAALLLIPLLGCDHAARHVTSPAEGDVAFARIGAPDSSGTSAPGIGREQLQRRSPLGFSEFFPLRAGNRWRYDISSTWEMLEGARGTARIFLTGYHGEHIQEQTCTGDNFGVSYLFAFDSTHVLGEGYESSISYWTMMRQDRHGLYEVDYSVEAPPCSGPAKAASRAAPLRAAWAAQVDRDRQRFAATPQWSAHREAWEAAWRAHAAKQATIESIIFENGPPSFEPERPLRKPADGELLLLAYPLEVGREWIVRNRPEYRSQVEAQEPVQVPAGNFTGYRLHNRSELFPRGTDVWFWYGSHGVLKQGYTYETQAVDTTGNVVGLFRSRYQEVLAEVDLKP